MSNRKSEYDLIQSMALAPYRLVGDRINLWLRLFKDLDKQLLKGNVKVAFPAYVALILVFSALGGISIFAMTLLLSLVAGATLLVSLLLSAALGVSCGLVIFVVLYFYPAMQVGNRKRVLDEELPYIASHMAVLSAANLPPERIFRSITLVEAMGVRSIAAEESRNIIRDVTLLGSDIISAMELRIRNSPSRRFVDFIDGFISVTRSGGNLTAYFLASAKALMDSARIAARQLIETLGGIAEAYVSLMVVFPLLVIVMLSIMGMIGGSIGGLSIIFIMQLVTYLAIPVFAMILLLLLDSIIPPR